VVKQRLIDLRRRSRVRLVSLDEVGDVAADDGELDDIAGRVAVDALIDAMACPVERSVLRAYCDGRSGHAAARELGMTDREVTTVIQRLRRRATRAAREPAPGWDGDRIAMVSDAVVGLVGGRSGEWRAAA
jgi:DNA-directed RNA polymerase specialized sigma24 family protein